MHVIINICVKFQTSKFKALAEKMAKIGLLFMLHPVDATFNIQLSYTKQHTADKQTTDYHTVACRSSAMLSSSVNKSKAGTEEDTN